MFKYSIVVIFLIVMHSLQHRVIKLILIHDSVSKPYSFPILFVEEFSESVPGWRACGSCTRWLPLSRFLIRGVILQINGCCCFLENGFLRLMQMCLSGSLVALLGDRPTAARFALAVL